MTRTCDLQVRNLTLYPTELWARENPSSRRNLSASAALPKRVGELAEEPAIPPTGTLTTRSTRSAGARRKVLAARLDLPRHRTVVDRLSRTRFPRNQNE